MAARFTNRRPTHHYRAMKVVSSEPEGFGAISRWSSSDTTGPQAKNMSHPGRMPVMPSTYLSLHFHLVFSTKRREATLAPEWRSRLHDYLGGTVRGLGGYSDRVGGVADHVHLLVGLKATHCLADFMRELKKASSAWVHEEMGLRSFAWQEGPCGLHRQRHLTQGGSTLHR
jgi:REP element-mobilizing transposase RayT